ncbi:MAG TPA: PPC domain-containing DNA-binding protein [Micromonosporaceae bacterium]|nr:PPC domain-containing DNA-binding protein [Micromonosporaceae bacterium]
MQSREIDDHARRVLVIACDQGEEAVGTITQAVREHGIRAAQVTGVGGLQGGELGYYDRKLRDYSLIPIAEQVEVLSLLGDVAEHDGQPVVHLHAVLGRKDGSALGGHLMRGQVWPVLEVIVTEVAPSLAKRFDPETGLTLLAPQVPTRSGAA